MKPQGNPKTLQIRIGYSHNPIVVKQQTLETFQQWKSIQFTYIIV
jgi:hypothetical protein